MSAISSGCSRTRHRDRGVRADLGAGVDVVREQRSHRSEERVDLGALDVTSTAIGRHGRDPRVARGVEGIDAHALLALDERVRAATGQPPESADMCDDRDRVHVVEGRLVARGVALDREHDAPVAVHRCLERRDRARPARGQRAPAATGTRRCPGAAPPGASTTPVRSKPAEPARRARKARLRALNEHSRASAPSNVERQPLSPSRDARPRRSRRRRRRARCGARPPSCRRGRRRSSWPTRPAPSRRRRRPWHAPSSIAPDPCGGPGTAAPRERGIDADRGSRRAGARSRRLEQTPSTMRSSRRRTGAASRHARTER